ncbi:MAG: winged helix-turn-helix transcriptional regulator, partial [Oscillospiraceae bacterium]|nr:winged helix-turn-helix transcriptional regulator [Oscillospiraceae bacterium]
MADISGIDLMHQFHHTFNLMHRQYHQIANDKVGIRHGQGKILMILTREDGIGQKELAERLQIRAATLSELLDKMQ